MYFAWCVDARLSSLSRVITENISSRSVFILLFVNLLVFEYGPPFLSGLFVTPVNTVGCLAVSNSISFGTPS